MRLAIWSSDWRLASAPSGTTSSAVSDNPAVVNASVSALTSGAAAASDTLPLVVRAALQPKARQTMQWLQTESGGTH